MSIQSNYIKTLKKISAFPFVMLIRFYQYALSPYLGGSKCRFTPTCSEYSKESINRYGIIQGLKLSILRLIRCNPLSKGGFDPVPDKI